MGGLRIRIRIRRAKSRRGARVRAGIALAAIAGAVAAATLLPLYVAVTSRFDGRLWPIPSRVYSDVLSIERGAELSPDKIQARLQRSGYARTTTAPQRAGQYRNEGNTLEVHLRGFRSPSVAADARRVTLRFTGGRVASIRDGDGRRAARVTLEPEVLATLYGPRQEERRPIRRDQVPQGFVQAVLAAEDVRFFRHGGLDLRGIARAAWANLRHGRIVQGGSTITQQTVKNLYLDQRRTWWRKLREVPMALILDARYSKQRILEVYLNDVYLGQSGSVAICGVEAAARFYFGLPLAELTPGEWALLAGMIRSPGHYNPFVHPKRAIERRDAVLQAMGRLGTIEPAALEAALGEPLRLASGGRGFARAPYAVDFVQSQLAELYPRSLLREEGLNVYTTIDTRIQARAETALERGLASLARKVGADNELQGAVLVTQPRSGAILAMIGGRDYRRSQFNRAAQARRQPGSCFKPLVYAAGFELAVAGEPSGLTPATLLEDSPLELVAGGKPWHPANYDRSYRGAVTARRALEESLNVPTVRAAQHVGLQPVIDIAERCGVRSPLAPLPSLALGTAELTPLELAAIYGAFADGGRRTTPWILRAVTDRDGRRLAGGDVERGRALSPEAAFLVSDLLRGVFERGTARSAERHGFRASAAGKTGTTDDTRDSWFVGFNDALLALVWVGFDDNRRTGLTGASGALPIWADLMRGLPEGRIGLTLHPPEGIVDRAIDVETGDLAVGGCPDVRREHFVRGTEPQQRCSLHERRFKHWFRRLVGRRGRVG